jgi:hypothetical protein
MRNTTTTAEAVRAAMAAAANFMAVGAQLKAAGVKYRFSTEPPMPPAYIVTIGGSTWFIVNEKYADEGSYAVNGIGLTR